MTNFIKWLSVSLTLGLLIFALFNWHAYTGIASLTARSQTSWCRNNKINTVSVIVRDETGKPVVDADVKTIDPSGSRSGKTDLNGRAELQSAEDSLLCVMINDVAVMKRTGLIKPLDLSDGLDVYVTLYANQRIP